MKITHLDYGLTPKYPDAPLAVLLPGLDSTVPVRVPFLRALGAQVPFLHLLLPFDSITTMSEAEAYFRELLPSDRPFAVFGYSFTGPVAIRIAANPPPGLAAVGLLATFARLKLPLPLWMIRPVVRPLLFRIPAPTSLVRFLAGCGNPWVLRELQKAQRTVPAPILASRLRACFDIDVREDLKRIRVPLANIIATQDSILPAYGEREISRIRPDSRLTVIPGGHALLECTPNQAACAIADFLLGIPSEFQVTAE